MASPPAQTTASAPEPSDRPARNADEQQLADERAEKAKRLIATGATAAALGVVMSLWRGGTLAALLTLLGIALLLVGVHSLGRSGPG